MVCTSFFIAILIHLKTAIVTTGAIIWKHGFRVSSLMCSFFFSADVRSVRFFFWQIDGSTLFFWQVNARVLFYRCTCLFLEGWCTCVFVCDRLMHVPCFRRWFHFLFFSFDFFFVSERNLAGVGHYLRKWRSFLAKRQTGRLFINQVAFRHRECLRYTR